MPDRCIRRRRRRVRADPPKPVLELLESRVLLTAAVVQSTLPGPNAIDAPVDTDVALTFDQALDGSTVDDQSVVVHAMQSGRLLTANGSIASLSTAGATVTIDPTAVFHAGETIRVTATDGVRNALSEPSVRAVTEFRAATSGGAGVFVETFSITGLGAALGRDVVLGDLNGDTDPDALIVGAVSSEVRLNDGSGNLIAANALLAGFDGRDAALDDFDADGDLDAFIVYGGADAVWLNDGSGSFTESGQALGGDSSFAVATGDLDGDGDPDVIVTGEGPGRVWLNDGSARFADSGQILGAGYAEDVALGDLDGDTDLDAFVAEHGESRVWLNDGSGNLVDTGQSLLRADVDTYGVALGDLDGDNDLDAFATGDGPDLVWRNDGSGNFADSGQDLGSGAGVGVALGDLDGDGDFDAFVANGYDFGGDDEVWLNDGSGNFTDSGQQIGSFDSYSYGVALGDLDDDGDLDAVVTDGEIYFDAIRVWGNDGSGNFSAGNRLLGNSYSYGAALGDLNDDGALDIFVANDGANRVWNGAATPGSTTFADSGQVLGDAESADVELDDLDGDGDLDAFVANDGSNAVWLNDGSGNFTVNGQVLGGRQSNGVALGDFDADGDVDAFVANGASTGEQPNVLWLNDGSGNFTDSGQQLGTAFTYDVAAGDLDGDGDFDVFAANDYEDLVWRNDGSGNFMEDGQSLAGAYSADVALGDLDGDTDLDAFVANAYGSNRVWRNDGSGNFSKVVQFLGSGYTYGVALGDLDDDGDLDAFVADGFGYFGGQANSVWLNDGSGTFTDSGQAIGNGYSYDVDLGDFDGDGDLDAFVANEYANAVWFNDGSADFGATGAGADPDGFNVATALGDLDGDADLDAFVARLGPNEVRINDGRGDLGTRVQRLGNGLSIDAGLGDLDGDGDLDAFVANLGPNRIWLNGEGPGTPLFIDSGQALDDGDTNAVALGDLDGDGDLDAFTANGVFGNAANKVWRNDGAGNFSDSGQSLGIAASRDVALADLDGDGDLDAYVENVGDDSVWFNDGAGNFDGALPQAAVAAGDLDGDGDVDLFVAAGQGERGNGASGVWRNLGVNSGVFSDTGQALGDADSRDVKLADLDDDGDLDAFVANEGANRIWRNDGSGNFTVGAQTMGSAASRSVVIADVDGDTDLDAFVANDGANRVWRNDGSGNFTDSGQALGAATSEGVALADLDGDLVLDAYVANDGMNRVWRNDGSGNFIETGQALGVAVSRDVALGDLDGDGDGDAFVANDGENRIWLNDGSAGFSQGGAGLGTSNSAGVALADLDGDTDLDAFIANGHRSAAQADSVWLNDGSGNFTASPQALGAARSTGVVTSNIDSDGDVDAIVATEGRFNLWLNDASGGFTAAGSGFSPFSGSRVALGDVDDDGDVDVLVSDGDGGAVLINDGAGGLSDSGQAMGTSDPIVELGDVDGDGDLDAFVAGDGLAGRIWFNDGSGQFTEGGQTLVNEPYAFTFGDLDGDGDLDIHAADYLASSVWLNQDARPPRVEAVEVRSSAWSAAFTDHLRATGAGNGGFAVAAGAAQLDPLVWSDIDEIVIRFTEPVKIDRADVTLRGALGPDGVAGGPDAYSFDLTTGTGPSGRFEAVLTIAAPIRFDRLVLSIDGTSSVTDVPGTLLDGEWLDGASTFPSGDGDAGGDFSFRFDVAPADVDRDGATGVFDIRPVRDALGTSAGDPLYSVFADLNGDGTVDDSDQTVLRNEMGRSLPAGAPAPIVGNGVPGTLTLTGADRVVTTPAAPVTGSVDIVIDSSNGTPVDLLNYSVRVRVDGPGASGVIALTGGGEASSSPAAVAPVLNVGGNVDLAPSEYYLATASFETAAFPVNDGDGLIRADYEVQPGALGIYTFDILAGRPQDTALITGLDNTAAAFQVNAPRLIVTIPGDFDGDFVVGANDLQIVLSRFTQQVPVGDLSQGDATGAGGVPDGVVGIADLQLILTRFTDSITPPTARSSFDLIDAQPTAGAAGLDRWHGWLRSGDHQITQSLAPSSENEPGDTVDLLAAILER